MAFRQGVMNSDIETLDAVRAALASTPRLDLQAQPIDLAIGEGSLTMHGEVASVAAKKLALEAAAAVPEVVGIVDCLRVTPAQPMGDGQIRDLLRDAYLQEPAFQELVLAVLIKGEWRVMREPADVIRGAIEVEVSDGVVTLNGEVTGLGLKRLAGVLAWWVPGSRDVVNGLVVTPDQADNDFEMADAVRLALEKDPYVNASQVRVGARDSVVRLRGLVPTESEKKMAEADSWYVFGVDKVENELEVRA